ncbi:hypothetical protein F2P79_019278, partial [Pimephales promelas]
SVLKHQSCLTEYLPCCYPALCVHCTELILTSSSVLKYTRAAELSISPAVIQSCG